MKHACTSFTSPHLTSPHLTPLYTISPGQALRTLEAAGEEGLPSAEQRGQFGIALEDYEALSRLLSHLVSS
jgi:hypothetical protein